MNKERTKGMEFYLMKIHLQHTLLEDFLIVCLGLYHSWVCFIRCLFWLINLFVFSSSLFCPQNPDHEIRGYKISVAMAEKSAPKAASQYGYGYIILHNSKFCDCVSCLIILKVSDWETCHSQVSSLLKSVFYIAYNFSIFFFLWHLLRYLFGYFRALH